VRCLPARTKLSGLRRLPRATTDDLHSTGAHQVFQPARFAAARRNSSSAPRSLTRLAATAPPAPEPARPARQRRPALRRPYQPGACDDGDLPPPRQPSVGRRRFAIRQKRDCSAPLKIAYGAALCGGKDGTVNARAPTCVRSVARQPSGGWSMSEAGGRSFGVDARAVGAGDGSLISPNRWHQPANPYTQVAGHAWLDFRRRR
jgi:hypothetical protein